MRALFLIFLLLSCSHKEIVKPDISAINKLNLNLTINSKELLAKLDGNECIQCTNIIGWIMATVLASDNCDEVLESLPGMFAFAAVLFYDQAEDILNIQPIAESTIKSLCKKKGYLWVRIHPEQVAKIICQESGHCLK